MYGNSINKIVVAADGRAPPPGNPGDFVL